MRAAQRNLRRGAAVLPERVGIVQPVSYTHLDVYKRQARRFFLVISSELFKNRIHPTLHKNTPNMRHSKFITHYLTLLL